MKFAPGLLLAVALLSMSSSASGAAGSYEKRPMFDHLVIAGVPRPTVTLLSLPEINPGQILGGAAEGGFVIHKPIRAHGPDDIGP
jgi:hypothetical protein